MEMSAAVRDGWLSVCDAEEIFRLALLGLERDDLAESLRVNVGIALTLFASELGCAPTSGDILAAIESLKASRDERAEKIGRAVLDAVMAGDAGRLGTPSQTLDEMADEVDAAAYWLTTPGEVLRSIADALREEAGR